MKKRVLVVSSANLDFVQRIKRLPLRGESCIDRGSFGFYPGGGGANSAVTFSRLGSDCVFCTRLGEDGNGTRLKAIYEREGIDTRFIARDRSAQTGFTSVIIEGDGSRRTVIYPGASERLTAGDVEEAFTSYPDGVYIQFEIPEEAALAAAHYAHEANIPLYVDAGPARQSLSLTALGRMEILSLNEEELFAYTGIRPNNAETCFRAAIQLSMIADAHYYVIKLGARGAYVYDGRYTRVLPAIPVTVVDTSAAGDIFTSALTHFHMEGKTVEEAAHLANCAAAIGIGREGAYASIPTRKELLAFVEDHPLETV